MKVKRTYAFLEITTALRDVTRMSMATVSFLAQQDSANYLPIECFPLTYDLNGFKCRFFLNRFPVCLNLFVLLFLVTPCLVVAVQPCLHGVNPN